VTKPYSYKVVLYSHPKVINYSHITEVEQNKQTAMKTTSMAELNISFNIANNGHQTT